MEVARAAPRRAAPPRWVVAPDPPASCRPTAPPSPRPTRRPTRRSSEVLRAAFPDHDVLSEESGTHGPVPATAGGSSIRSTGREDFLRGDATWGPLVALEHEGRLERRGDGDARHRARRGGPGAALGCVHGGERVHVSAASTWRGARLVVGFLRPPARTAVRQPRVLDLLERVPSTRCPGDLASLFLPAGRSRRRVARSRCARVGPGRATPVDRRGRRTGSPTSSAGRVTRWAWPSPATGHCTTRKASRRACARRAASGCQRPLSGAFAAGFLKPRAAPPDTTSSQSTSAAVISARETVDLGGRAPAGHRLRGRPVRAPGSGRRAPASGLWKKPWKEATPFTSAPLRARSSTQSPPKQKPMPAIARRRLPPVVQRRHRTRPRRAHARPERSSSSAPIRRAQSRRPSRRRRPRTRRPRRRCSRVSPGDVPGSWRSRPSPSRWEDEHGGTRIRAGLGERDPPLAGLAAVLVPDALSPREVSRAGVVPLWAVRWPLDQAEVRRN